MYGVLSVLLLLQGMGISETKSFNIQFQSKYILTSAIAPSQSALCKTSTGGIYCYCHALKYILYLLHKLYCTQNTENIILYFIHLFF